MIEYLENQAYAVSTWSAEGLICPDTFDVVPAGQEITLVIRTSVEISGRISIPNEPKPGRYLIDAQWEGSKVKTEITKENGSFSIPVPQGAVVELLVNGKKQSDEGRSFDFPQSKVYAGQLDKVVAPAENILIPLSPVPDDAKITVAVVDSAGNPIADAQISTRPWCGTKNTDDQGMVHFSDLRALAIDFSARAPDGSTGLFRSQKIKAVPQGQTITLTLRRAITIRGKVVDSKGNPVPWAYVEAVAMGGSVSNLSNNNVTSTNTDAEGTFTVKLGEAKEFRLHARAQIRPGSRPPRAGKSVVVTNPGVKITLTIP